MKCHVPMGLLLALEACSDSPQVYEDRVRLDEHHTLGASVAVSNPTVWPVFADCPLDLGEFLTLSEALLTVGEPARGARATDVVALVRGIADTREEVNETAGLNRNGIKATRAAFHSSCYVEREGKGWIALTSDWTAR